MARNADTPAATVTKASDAEDDVLKRYCPLLCAHSEDRIVSQPAQPSLASTTASAATVKPFSRLKKRRRLHPPLLPSLVAHDVVSRLVDAATVHYDAKVAAQSVIDSVLNAVSQRSLNAAIKSGACDDHIPSIITNLPTFIAGLAKNGYYYGMHYCRPHVRRTRYCLSARLRCLNHIEPWKCTAAFTAKLRSDKSVWETNGVLTHTHLRNTGMARSGKERYHAIVSSLKSRLPRGERLPFLEQLIPPEFRPKPKHTNPKDKSRSHAANPNLPVARARPLAPRGLVPLPVVVPRLPYVMQTPNGPVLVLPQPPPHVPPQRRTIAPQSNPATGKES
ncbi:hypothetical protein BWQ96_03070 [Gracilariopsis chorda]|uniref:Uncharacterized protein n=1 Tax=Gracilariopsis chorda TaxID=448386 RepID=A0A2V3IY99_9FLOR|nr:hypothetical protein BWQ96_03070 [Gracilariopsis chorda]|eukprot:PXF47128.1 hypothetical protein BWQ96_03070 [Gracilariopsis chorda]